MSVPGIQMRSLSHEIDWAAPYGPFIVLKLKIITLFTIYLVQ
jgi:hypothetical protein